MVVLAAPKVCCAIFLAIVNMGKNKNKCWACSQKHYPPTGKNCVFAKKNEETAVVEVPSENDARDSSSSKVVLKKSVAPEKDSVVSRGYTSGHTSSSDTEEEDSSMEEGGQRDMQHKILSELQKVSSRLTVVEAQMASGQGTSKKGAKGQKLSTVVKCKKRKCHKSCCSKTSSESSDSSDDGTVLPDLSHIRSSKSIQKQIDRSIAKLSKAQCEGNENLQKLKSKRGGPVDVIVQKKVSWPHEHILGGQNRQRLTYDQITMPQFVQGFVKNILDEKSQENRDHMLQYLGDIMEDASDFSWQSAKASHAVLLCEMERGKVTWQDTTRIDRVRRAYAQKHQGSGKQSWGQKVGERKPWFCKQYQTGSCTFDKDHDTGGKLHRHICATCLSQGRQLSHPERDCHFAKKAVPKNG